MSQAAIRVARLGKRYRIRSGDGIYSYRTLRDSISNVFHASVRTLTSKSPRRREDPFLWALKDASFEIRRGEVLGIIGRNGSGKTTLLKILSRITSPTEGTAEIHGRVGSLLEVGTGFHPELTGRENIYFNGSVLGMKKAEIDRRFDEIVAFAEIERFMDTPVKHYSSGMYVRLAFAVAAHLETEILLVDEVLSVGDIAFQRKCLGKIADVTESGRAILFVSHSMNVVAQLCQQAIVLHQGRLVLKAPVAEAIAEYLSETAQKGGRKTWPDEKSLEKNRIFQPLSLMIRNASGKVTDTLSSTEPFWIEIEYGLSDSVRDLRVGITISTGDGSLLFGAFDADNPAQYIEKRSPGRYISRCCIQGNWLNAGRFILGINAGIFHTGRLFQEEHVLTFDMIKTGGAGSQWGETPGREPLRPLLDWRVECLEPFAR